MSGMGCVDGARCGVMAGSEQQNKQKQQRVRKQFDEFFQMPLHYPRYKRSDYEGMPEWKLDCLLKEYGLPVVGDVSHKRNFAIGAFLWPSCDQY